MSRTAIITGAAGGIGRGLVAAYADAGFRLMITDLNEEGGEKLVNSLKEKGASAGFVRCDLSDPEQIEQLAAYAENEFGRVDVLINNAGISEFTPAGELTADAWDRILNTNLRSAFLLTKLTAPIMSRNGGGSVVNIASTRALMSEPDSEAYAASKGGLLALTHAMAMSYSEQKITVNCISPGWIHHADPADLRDMDHSQHPSGRVGTPGDIARACLFLTDPTNRFINGENFVIDGGMTRKMIYEH